MRSLHLKPAVHPHSRCVLAEKRRYRIVYPCTMRGGRGRGPRIKFITPVKRITLSVNNHRNKKYRESFTKSFRYYHPLSLFLFLCIYQYSFFNYYERQFSRVIKRKKTITHSLFSTAKIKLFYNSHLFIKKAIKVVMLNTVMRERGGGG